MLERGRWQTNPTRTKMIQNTLSQASIETTFVKMNACRRFQPTKLILNFILCYIALAARVILADISEMKLPQAPQVNLTSLIQDMRVWNTESLYHMEDIQTPKSRQKRSTGSQSNQLVVDMCQSKMEVLTPYYATNSKGILRTIINSELMQQAIQVETCIRSPNYGAGKCNSQPDCGCEQKYKWHRLLSLDPKHSTKGLFMDWFLFPSNCVCRCKSTIATSIFAGKQQSSISLINKPQP